jgi:hypothetical protein
VHIQPYKDFFFGIVVQNFLIWTNMHNVNEYIPSLYLLISAPHYIVQLHTKELASYDLQLSTHKLELSTNQGKTKCKPSANQIQTKGTKEGCH